jgi:outer membrane immunogenic protein
MKAFSTGGAILLAMAAASSAFAADVETVATPDLFGAPPAFATRPLYNWTGAYVGINGGGGFGRSTWTSTPDGTSGTYDPSGGLIGGTFGYNLQGADSLVLGGEVDIAATSFKGTIPAAACLPGCEITSPWLASARLRFGYSLGDIMPIMPYITFGASIGRLVANTSGAPFGTERANNLSWTVGGGAEFVLSGPWTAKVEYLYVDLSGISCSVACGGGPISINLNENIVRVGINYRIWQR